MKKIQLKAKRPPGRPKGSTKLSEARTETIGIPVRPSVKKAYLGLPRGERVGIVENGILSAKARLTEI